MASIQRPTVSQQMMNRAIQAAYLEGDDAKLDALLATKLIVARQEAQAQDPAA